MGSGSEYGAQIPALLLTICATPGKLPNFSELLLSHL